MRPPRLVRYALALVILCAAAVATLLAVIPFIVSTDAIRIRVAQEISSWTGYNVELREAPRLTVFPVLKASLNGVTLSKQTDNGQKAMMSADRIEVELSPIDALMGHISFTETQVIRPHVLMDAPISNFSGFLEAIANSSGRLGTAIRAARALNDSANNNTAAPQQLSQPFGRVMVKDGIISFNPQGADKDELITAVNATFDWPRTTSSASFSGKAKWRGQQSQFTVTAAQLLPLFARGTSDVSLDFVSQPVNLTFQGKANVSDNSFFEGALNVKAPSLPGAFRWLNLPPIAGIEDMGETTASTNLTANHQRLRLADLDMQIAQSSAKGFLEITLGQSQPNITGTLAFETLDLHKLFALFIPLPVKQAVSPNDRGTTDEIDTRLISKSEVDLRLSAQNAKAGQVSMTGLGAAIQIRGGRANFDIGDAKAFGGTVQMNLQIIRDLKTALAEWRFNASDIDSNQFLQIFGFDKPIISGKGNVSMSMKGPANRWSQLFSAAQGNVSAQLNNGQMQGFSLPDFLQKAREQRFFGLQRKDNVALAFNRLEVKASLADGVASLDQARIATNDGTLNLAGIVPFVDRSLALSGEVTFPSDQSPQTQQPTSGDNATANETPGKMPFSFFVGGSWDRPFISPSTSAIGAPAQ